MSERLRILWLKTGPLHPLDTGGRLRTYHMLRELHRRHEVTFLALAPIGTQPEHLEAAREYSSAQVWVPWQDRPRRSIRGIASAARNALTSALPFSIAKYQSPGMQRELARRDAGDEHDLIVCDFLTPAVNFPPGKLRKPTLLFEHNVESQIWQRMAQAAENAVLRLYFRSQLKRMIAFERRACARCSGVVTVSEEDATILRRDLQVSNVLGAVPTGVDTAYFAEVPPRPEPGTLVFLGSMDWMPNIDGILWFAETMWPAIRAKHPGVRLRIVGRNPPPKVQALGREAGIEVTGTVPDVRPHLAASELMIVPLRVGGGTRIKIYEGMAAGLPVLSTTIGAEGLSIVDGETIALADTPEDFARRTVELLGDHAVRSRLASAGQRLVVDRFGWASVAEVFTQHCRTLLP